MQDFIVNLGVGVNWGTAANLQLFLGNPGDYAWGREGLDAIVTQLLNQMDSTGTVYILVYLFKSYVHRGWITRKNNFYNQQDIG